MLSKAHPITNLFETLEHDPINYLRRVQDLMEHEPVVPPEPDLVSIYNIPGPTPSIESMMELNLDKINSSSVGRYKSAFYDLGSFVAKNHISVSFPGLTNYKKKYTKDQCCSWFSQHKSSPKREMVQLLSAIQAQSKPSERQWIIEVTNG